jgi:uncharacterized protein (TIGR02145 family)
MKNNQRKPNTNYQISKTIKSIIMINIYAFLCLTLLLVTNKTYSQNEELVIWKNGTAIYSQSTSLEAMDSITFRKAEVTICNQVWATRNLDVTTYRNGDPIPQVTDPTLWANLTTGAWCYYNNDPANGPIYGKLYNWYAVNDPRGLAPTGWQVPSYAKWGFLINCLGGVNVAGGKMKSTGILELGTGLWQSPNVDATNASGFTGLPEGYRSNDGTFSNIGYGGYWWSSLEYDTTFAWNFALSYSTGGATNGVELPKNYGFSVRCLRN